MTAKDIAILERDSVELARTLRMGISMLPNTQYKVGLTHQQAVQLLSVLERTGRYFGWKLDATEVVNEYERNKRRSVKKRKRIHE